MDVIVVMCMGILAGRFLVPKGAKKGNDRISIVCTALLIFSMGVMLGRKENFLAELSSLGLSSLLFFLVPTALSIVVVFYLTRKFMHKDNAEEKEEKDE